MPSRRTEQEPHSPCSHAFFEPGSPKSSRSAVRRLAPAALERFGELVAAAAAPIDDVRGSAAYRRHALGVLARRTLTWAWEEQRCA